MTDEITTYNTEVLLAKAIEKLPAKTNLVYIDYRDELSNKECVLLVGGKKDEILENRDFDDSESSEIDRLLKDALPDEDERETFESSDEIDDFRTECRERDESYPLKDLIRNTGRKPVRFYIRSGINRVAFPEDSWRWSEHRTEVEARKVCKAAGLNWDLNCDAMIELVQNASYGGVLCIYAYVEMSMIDKITEHCLRGDERGRVKLTFTNPNLLAHDAWNGSGHDVTVKGDITIRFGRGALEETQYGVMALDARNVGTGYSWEESCGPYLPAYICDPEVELYRARRKQPVDQVAPEAWPGR